VEQLIKEIAMLALLCTSQPTEIRANSCITTAESCIVQIRSNIKSKLPKEQIVREGMACVDRVKREFGRKI
jgi:hypothetical protein